MPLRVATCSARGYGGGVGGGSSQTFMCYFVPLEKKQEKEKKRERERLPNIQGVPIHGVVHVTASTLTVHHPCHFSLALCTAQNALKYIYQETPFLAQSVVIVTGVCSTTQQTFSRDISYTRLNTQINFKAVSLSLHFICPR